MATRQLKVVHTVPSIAREASGPSYSVRRLCESLARQGCDATLCVVAPAPADAPALVKAFPPSAGPERLSRSRAMHAWLKRHAENGDIDVLHTHGLWSMVNVYPGQVAQRHALPLVVAPRGTLSAYAFSSGSPLKRLFWPLLQKPAIDVAMCFHATSGEECRDIRRMGFRQPVALVPNGIDIPPSASRHAFDDSGTRTLLYLGRLHPEKGLDMLLQAWAEVQPRHPRWQLRIVGPDIGHHERHLRQLARRLKLRRITFHGPLYGHDKWQAYSEADLYILPSPSENFAMTVAEALAAGTPVITTRGTPWQGLVDHRAGWWVDSRPRALADALHEAMSQPPHTLAAMGQRGRRWMRHAFSWDVIAEKMRMVYEWLVLGDSRPDFVEMT